MQIAPSILAADFTRLGEEVCAVEAAGADAIHIDVMDGHFVPNISIGIPIVETVRTLTKLPLDCHLMISEPAKYVVAFATAGANWISVHAETGELMTVLGAIKHRGCRAGVAINPPTPIEQAYRYCGTADYFLVMSVNPGFAGQQCIPAAFDKVRILKTELERRKLMTPIQIDGGITTGNVGTAKAAGASIIVAASAIFKSHDYTAAIRALRSEKARFAGDRG